MMFSLPNLLTLFRIAVILPLVGLFYIQQPWAVWSALALYIVAALTDFFDGYLARTMNQMSAFGRFLDPIADKLFVAATLVMLAGFGRIPGVWLIPAIVIMMREILIAGLREFLGPHKIVLPVSRLAKWKTAAQMGAIGFLIVGSNGNIILPYTLEIGRVGLVFAAVLTVVTGWDYMKTGVRIIRAMDD
jgi:cardiolipin synthase (CMP-forming)